MPKHEHTPPTFLTLAALALAVKANDIPAINTIVKPYDGCVGALILFTSAITQAVLVLENYVQGSAIIFHTPDSLAEQETPLEVAVAQQLIDVSRETRTSEAGVSTLLERLEACDTDLARDELASGVIVVLGRTLHGMMHATPGTTG